MRVLGIDPGSHRTGWGIVDVQGSRVIYVASGLVAAGEGNLAVRLCRIAEGLEDVMRQHAPKAASVETVFFAKNSQSALALGQARGVALLVAQRNGADVHEYTAGQIKQATVGRGRAEKEQVRDMVSLLLGLRDKTMALDTSDALAAAICHAHMAATPTAQWLLEQSK